MQRLGDILDLDLPIGEEIEDIAKIAKLHLSAAQTALNVQVRVDEARLRRQTTDILPEIVRILAEEKSKLAHLKIVEAAQ